MSERASAAAPSVFRLKNSLASQLIFDPGGPMCGATLGMGRTVHSILATTGFTFQGVADTFGLSADVVDGLLSVGSGERRS
jgi:hypothetical protein